MGRPLGQLEESLVALLDSARPSGIRFDDAIGAGPPAGVDDRRLLPDRHPADKRRAEGRAVGHLGQLHRTAGGIGDGLDPGQHPGATAGRYHP